MTVSFPSVHTSRLPCCGASLSRTNLLASDYGLDVYWSSPLVGPIVPRCHLTFKRLAHGMKPASTNSANYVEARQRLPEELLLELARSTGNDCDSRARSKWLWKGSRSKNGRWFHGDDARHTGKSTRVSTTQYSNRASAFDRASRFDLLIGGRAALEIALGKYAGIKLDALDQS